MADRPHRPAESLSFDKSEFLRALESTSLGHEVDSRPVVLSVEVAAQQWGRQGGAAHGALVVSESEVAPKGRMSLPWTVGGQAAAFVLRPHDLAPENEGRLWVAAGLALAKVLEGTVRWPDLVISGEATCSINVVTLLGPGKVELAVVAVRIPPGVLSEWSRFLARLALAFEQTLASDNLVDSYLERFPLVGTEVEVSLMPRGVVAATVAGVSASGSIRLAMGSGRIGELPVSQTRWVTPVG